MENKCIKKCNGYEMMARSEECSAVATDRRIDAHRLGERVASVDDIKASALK